jgi:hypothetical protein
MLTNNVILNSDSYKYSQYDQYPEGTEYRLFIHRVSRSES